MSREVSSVANSTGNLHNNIGVLLISFFHLELDLRELKVLVIFHTPLLIP